MEVHGALNGGLLSLPWGKRDGLGLVWEIEDKEESVQMSLTASSDDFCSREISEFEKLLCLQIRTKKCKYHICYTHHTAMISACGTYCTHCTYRLVITLPVSHWERKR